MKNKIIAINGESYCRNITGIERVATETIEYLDTLASPGEIELILPANAKRVPVLKNIKVVQLQYEISSYPKWTQFVFQKYVRTHHAVSLDFTNTCPLFHPGIEYIHDIYCKLYPADFKTRHDKIVRLYSSFMYGIIARHAKKIIAVSEYTKKTIVDTYHINPKRIEVIYDGLGQYNTIPVDSSIFSKFPQLKNKDFYFTLGSLSVRKNLKWIADHAALYPNELFVVSGKALPDVVPPYLEKMKSLKNVIMAGYLSDGEVKAILSECKAFIFPSYFEGFGLPPLEALSCGAQIIISNSTCLPEIYGKSAHYINPDEPNVDLERLLEEPVANSQEILHALTIEKSAKQLYKVIKSV